MTDIERRMLRNQLAIMRALLATTDGFAHGRLDQAIKKTVKVFTDEEAETLERGRLLVAMYGDGPGAGGI